MVIIPLSPSWYSFPVLSGLFQTSIFFWVLILCLPYYFWEHIALTFHPSMDLELEMKGTADTAGKMPFLHQSLPYAISSVSCSLLIFTSI